jgi:hypothetical protein
MTTEQLIERDRQRLEANITESKRQMQFAGERLGVFGRLRELERERKRIARRLIERDPAREDEYAAHLMF